MEEPYSPMIDERRVESAPRRGLPFSLKSSSSVKSQISGGMVPGRGSGRAVQTAGIVTSRSFRETNIGGGEYRWSPGCA